MSLLRKIAPKSLYARTLLIVALPIFIMQSVITYVFFNRHWEEVSGSLSANVAGDIALISRLYENAVGPLSRDDIAKISREDLDIAIRFEAGGVIPEKDKEPFISVLEATLDKQLNAALDAPYWYNTSNYPAYVEIRVQLASGYLVFLPRRDRVLVTNGPIFILWMIGTTMLLGFVAITFLRNQIRSIQKLAQAAEDFGRGRDRPDFKPTGAAEVRLAGHAFLAMRQRINRHLSQRTAMLAGVSHDLRTPLTRMKLAMAMQPDTDDTKDLREDINEMERMLDEYLTFARTQNVDDAESVDVAHLLAEIKTDMSRSGHDLSVSFPSDLRINARKTALKRALSNLVTNAFKHGTTVELTTQQEDNHISFMIDDDGPGIDPASYDEVFKPFSRLDKARNQNTSGVGLGLTVVRDVARAHGGDIILARAPAGGLRATLRIPI